ncbi:MAG: cation diffusion facilitator family transporter [Hyphomicrobiaceae bacterium]
MKRHAHGAHGHVHGAGNERAVGIAALLTGGFMLVEVVGGVISGSLALLADAGHMLTDFASLVLAWLAFRLARRPADWQRTYGFDRFSVLAAFVNGISLFAIAGWICIEAYHRLTSPIEILGGLMLWVAVAGLIVNILAFWVLMRAEGGNLNVRAAALHVAGDLLGSVAAIVASLVIIVSGWTPIDPILSVLVALIILRSAWHVVRESGHILLEGAPRGFDRREVANAIETSVPGVKRVHHIHAWSITQERPMVTLEVEMNAGVDALQTKTAVKSILHEQFGVEHATVETN